MKRNNLSWREELNLSPKELRKLEQKKACDYMMKNFSREERFLRIYARDFAGYLDSAAWLQSEEARKFQKYYDFLADFAGLREKMKEFRWSKDFLMLNGIDFSALKKLYFAVA